LPYFYSSTVDSTHKCVSVCHMETNTTCTGIWTDDWATTIKVGHKVAACLTLDEQCTICPTTTIMRCTGCTDRLVIVAGQRIERLEHAATDHPDHRDEWVESIVDYVLARVDDARPAPSSDDDYDADMDEAAILSDRDLWVAEAAYRERIACPF
jgi:hypothetical protein